MVLTIANDTTDMARSGPTPSTPLSPASPTAAQSATKKKGEQAQIERYLSHLIAQGQSRRPLDTESIQSDLSTLEAQPKEPRSPLKVLEAAQKIADLRGLLTFALNATERKSLETNFIEHAAEFAATKGFTVDAFRSLGVPSEVLTKAKIR